MSEEKTTMTREQIEDRVAQALVQALGVSRDRITPSTSLVGDLEAESIDFLDLVFRLEKDFGIEIPRGDLFPQELLRDPSMVSQGKLTAEGAAALRQRFAFTDVSALEEGTGIEDLMTDLLTVRLIVDYVESKVPSGVRQPAR
jgi:acyl carrier protein